MFAAASCIRADDSLKQSRNVAGLSQLTETLMDFYATTGKLKVVGEVKTR
jgi:hypothetical protein